MAARTAALALALGASHASAALTLLQQEFSAAGCGASSLEKSEQRATIGTPFEAGEQKMKYTCTTDTITMSTCADDACTESTPVHSMDRGVCKEEETGKWAKYDCVEPATSGVRGELFSASKTCSGASTNVVIGQLGCTPNGEFNSGTWTSKSEHLKISNGALVSENYNSRDCSGTPAETKNYPCSTCAAAGDMKIMSFKPTCAGLTSDAPGAVIGRAAVAAVMAVLATVM